MSPVLVLRHEAIPLAMSDEYWTRYKVAKAIKYKGFDGKDWKGGNPIWKAPPEMAAYSLEAFIRDGGVVLACNLAFAEVVSTVQRADKSTPEAARAQALTMLLPGVILQPSGVFAVLRAQEAGCHYIIGS